MISSGFYNGQKKEKSGYTGANMSDREFEYLSSMIHDESRISLSGNKKIMLVSRLNKRLRHYGMSDYTQYYNFLKSAEGRANEMSNMIDAVTTNKTDFFREPRHFDVISRIVLPELITSGLKSSEKNLKIWSAGCATGEEPYTIAMVVSEFLSQHRGFDYSITATDISNEVLSGAKKGIYNKERVEPVPQSLRKKYLLRGKGPRDGYVCVAPEIRAGVKFMKHNLKENNFSFVTPFDIIFCRNVIIYFDRETRINLFQKFYGSLNDGGYIFIGNSETLRGISDRFEFIAPGVYRKIPGRGVKNSLM